MTRPRAVDALLLAGLVVAMLAASTVVRMGAWGFDALSYWQVDPMDPYVIPWRDLGAFVYAPPVALLAAPLHLLPWPAFLAGWTALLAAVLVALAPGRAALLLLLPPVALELYYGNVHLLLAAAIVVGFRHPSAWAFVLLTKVTPGVGLAWFVARRDWRSLGVALGATAAIAGVSLALTPDLWREWVGRLSGASGTEGTWLGAILGPLWLRVPVAAVIAFAGGIAGQRWPVAVAAFLAVPGLWAITPSLLVALVPLVAMDRRDPLPAMWRRQSRIVTDTSLPGVA